MTGWQGATKEHSRQRSVTEEQRRQRVIRSQPFGLPVFFATASLLVGQRSLRIFSLLAPRAGEKSLATHPFPFYEMGSSSKHERSRRLARLRPIGLRRAAFAQRSAWSEGWWEVLVMLQSSLPACLETPVLQTGSRVTSQDW